MYFLQLISKYIIFGIFIRHTFDIWNTILSTPHWVLIFRYQMARTAKLFCYEPHIQIREKSVQRCWIYLFRDQRDRGWASVGLEALLHRVYILFSLLLAPQFVGYPSAVRRYFPISRKGRPGCRNSIFKSIRLEY